MLTYSAVAPTPYRPILTVDDGMEMHWSDRAEMQMYPPAEWLSRMKARLRGVRWVAPPGTSDQVVVTARVDAGRWIVQCPSCPTAMWVTWRDPRFLCDGCGNAAHGGRWLHVAFPPNREECERVLAARPPVHQFWDPDSEDVAVLMGENVTRGFVPYVGYG
jgi:hypothetical protein